MRRMGPRAWPLVKAGRAEHCKNRAVQATARLAHACEVREAARPSGESAGGRARLAHACETGGRGKPPVRYAKSIGSESRIVAGHPHRDGRRRHAMEQVRMRPEVVRCQRHATGESMPGRNAPGLPPGKLRTPPAVLQESVPGRNAPGLPARLASVMTLEVSPVLRHARPRAVACYAGRIAGSARLEPRYAAAAAAAGRTELAAEASAAPCALRSAAGQPHGAIPRSKRLRRPAHCAPPCRRNGCPACIQCMR